MASERSTDVQAFIGELDGGVFETKIGAVLSESRFRCDEHENQREGLTQSGNRTV